MNVDFAVGGSVKWLCGGPGAGWLYVRPDLAETLEPTLVGWQAHARPFGFEPELEYAAGAWRFLTGTPNVPALYAATAGYDIVEEIGVDRIRDNSVRQTEVLMGLLDEARLEVVSPRETERRGGSIVVRVPDAPAVHAQLEEREIICDFRPDVGLRLGPHFFTTDEELELAVSAIREIVGRGATMRAPARSGLSSVRPVRVFVRAKPQRPRAGFLKVALLDRHGPVDKRLDVRLARLLAETPSTSQCPTSPASAIVRNSKPSSPSASLPRYVRIISVASCFVSRALSRTAVFLPVELLGELRAALLGLLRLGVHPVERLFQFVVLDEARNLLGRALRSHREARHFSELLLKCRQFGHDPFLSLVVVCDVQIPHGGCSQTFLAFRL